MAQTIGIEEWLAGLELADAYAELFKQRDIHSTDDLLPFLDESFCATEDQLFYVGVKDKKHRQIFEQAIQQLAGDSPDMPSTSPRCVVSNAPIPPPNDGVDYPTKEQFNEWSELLQRGACLLPSLVSRRGGGVRAPVYLYPSSPTSPMQPHTRTTGGWTEFLLRGGCQL